MAQATLAFGVVVMATAAQIISQGEIASVTVERDEIHDFVLIRRAKRTPFVHPARNSCSERNSGGMRPPGLQ